MGCSSKFLLFLSQKCLYVFQFCLSGLSAEVIDSFEFRRIMYDLFDVQWGIRTNHTDITLLFKQADICGCLIIHIVPYF